MKLYQFSCIEGKKVDLRQADAVLRHKPDVIIFEAPSVGRTPSLIYNKYKPLNKPLVEVVKHKKMLQRLAKKAPWVLSDVYVYDNIMKLWEDGHDVKLYNVDASSELLRVNLEIDENWDPKPYRRGTHFQWWVRIYLREKIMAENIQWVLSQNKKKDLKVLNFLQSFHWRNVQFLMSNPSKKKIYEYYFGKFRNINMKTIGEKVKEENKNLYKYWKKVSDFG
jgi:hypothetical protein